MALVHAAWWRFALTIALLIVAGPVRAQEPVWAVRAGVGVLSPTATTALIDDATLVALEKPAPTLEVSAIRQVDAGMELFVTAALPIIPVSLATSTQQKSAGTISPLLLQLGLNYRIQRAPRRATRVRWFGYASPFLVASTSDRSSAVSLEDRAPGRVAFEIPVAVGAGLALGFRYRPTERFAYDINLRYQYLRVGVGEHGRLSLSPFVSGVGVMYRLF